MKSWMTSAGTRIVRVLSGRSNAYLVSGREGHVLVDSGAPGCVGAFRAAMAGIGPVRVDALVMTHAHYDHAGAAAFVRREYGAEVLVHGSERAVLESGRNETDAMIPRGTNPVTDLVGRFLVPLWVPRIDFGPCAADVEIGDRLDLASYGVDGYVIHTPGHSPGSVCVIVDSEIAICGDTIFGAIPGTAVPPWARDHGRMMMNWPVLLDTGARIFLPGHGSERNRTHLAAAIGH